jgi:hypothetical protein
MVIKHPPFLDLTYTVLGWSHRASQAVGSDRFSETMSRAEFYFVRAASHALTPGEEAIVTGLQLTLDSLIAADAAARVLLCESVSGMSAADATEFVELCESGED